MLRSTLVLCIFSFCSGQLLAQSTSDLVKKNADNLTVVIPGVTNEAGLGKNEGEAAGVPIALPPGVRIVQRPNKPFDPSTRLLWGIANTFYVDISFVFDDSALKVNRSPCYLPAGTIVECRDGNHNQNGIVLGPVLIPLPTPPPPQKGAGKPNRDTVTIYVGVACLNKNRSMPWEENMQKEDDVKNYPIAKDMYRLGNVTSHQGLQMLTALLSQYTKLRLPGHYNPQAQFEDGHVAPKWMAIYGLIQEMVWKVTDGPGIRKGELESFKKELAPYK